MNLTLPQLEVTTTDLKFHKHGFELPGGAEVVVMIPKLPGHLPSSDLGSLSRSRLGMEDDGERANVDRVFRGYVHAAATLDFDVYLVWRGQARD